MKGTKMKNLLITLIALSGLTVQAALVRKPVVSSKQKFNVLEITGYNEIYQDLQAGLDTEFLMLSIFENLTKNSEVQVHMDRLTQCNQDKNAKPATSAEVAQLIRNEIATMAKHLQAYEVDDQTELQSIIAEYDKMTADFEKLFKDAKLSTCEETIFPKYTDGERNVIVRYNNRVLFMLQLTKLD